MRQTESTWIACLCLSRMIKFLFIPIILFFYFLIIKNYYQAERKGEAKWQHVSLNFLSTCRFSQFFLSFRDVKHFNNFDNNWGLRCIVRFSAHFVYHSSPTTSVDTYGGSRMRTMYVAAVGAIRAFVNQCVSWIKF